MIIKNEISNLEFDTQALAVIMPTHEHLNLNLPKNAVFAFLGEHIDEYAQAHNAVQVGKFLSATKDYPIYVVKHKGIISSKIAAHFRRIPMPTPRKN